MLLDGRLGHHVLFVTISLLFQCCMGFNNFYVNVIATDRGIIWTRPNLCFTVIQRSVHMHVSLLLVSLYNFRSLAASLVIFLSGINWVTLHNTQLIKFLIDCAFSSVNLLFNSTFLAFSLRGRVPWVVIASTMGSILKVLVFIVTDGTCSHTSFHIFLIKFNRSSIITGPQRVLSWWISNWIKRFRYLRLYTIIYTSGYPNSLSLIELFASKSSFT